MKVVVVGFGQCGSKVTDEFSRLNSRARFRRGIEIVTGVFAVNTDAADLSGLTSVKSDYQHRILIGTRKTGSHGVGKVNELGAEIARQDSDKVIDAIRSAERFYEADAFLLVAGAAGGTGSGSMPIMAQAIRERHGDKPIYALVVLPFEHEETTEARTIHNSATCLKATFVKFERQLVIEYLTGGGQEVRYAVTNGKVPLSLTGVVDGRMFEGSDTVLVVGEVIK